MRKHPAAGHQGKAFSKIITDAGRHLGMSPSSANRYLTRLKEAGLIQHSGGLYWANHQ